MLFIRRKVGEWIAVEDAQGNVLEICIVRVGDPRNARVVELGFRSDIRNFRITRGPSRKDEPAMPLATLFSFISNALVAIQANPALASFLMNTIQSLLKQFAAVPATTAHTFQARAPLNLPPEPFTPEAIATWAHANQHQP